MGSNLGDRLGTLQGCVQAIGGLADTDVLAISPVYETAPVGGPAQPDYLNAVLIVATGLPPRDLLAAKSYDTSETTLACYSAAGFDQELRDRAASPQEKLLLVSAEDLYSR